MNKTEVALSSVANLPSRHGLFRVQAFKEGHKEHLLIWTENLDCEAPLVRVHSECVTGDALGSRKCDCGEQLRSGVSNIEKMGGGVLLYMAQEGRGIGLANKLRAYALQDQGHDTVDADQILGFGEDERRYYVAVDMLAALGITKVRLLTNNPTKLRALAEGGIEVAGRQELYGMVTKENRRYLAAKAHRSGHMLSEVLDRAD